MAKPKKYFICTECGYQTTKWLGQCPNCNEWNTFSEEIKEDEHKKSQRRTKDLRSRAKVNLKLLSEIKPGPDTRIKTQINEFDRIMGGGIFKDSLVLIGGEPGIGKSTLLLQVADKISGNGHTVLYVSGEESQYQIKERSKRLKIESDRVYLLNEIEMKKVETAISRLKPEVLIIDSIQTVYFDEIDSIPGSVSQIREVTARLMHIAKNKGITIFIIGHITKGGVIAGPRILEHMVDTVLYFEGDRDNYFRLLRSIKNRFGATNEIGIFEMTEFGLKEVNNISDFLITSSNEQLPGVVLSSIFEGTRNLIVEIQSLVSPTSFGMPRRLSTGIDFNRFTLMTAILEKKLHLPLQTMDIFINVTGGLKVTEPSLDLAILTSIAGAFKDQALTLPTIAFGEVGLNGEIRPVSRIEDRVRTGLRQGFKNFLVPLRNKKTLSGLKTKGAEVKYLKYVSNIFKHLN